MFETGRAEHRPTERGDATRDRLLAVALRLFRSRGFERTTMREIARAARVSLGAAYYYFPAKDALVVAFYDSAQERHAELARAAYTSKRGLPQRVRAALVSKLEVLRDDRALLGALFRYAGEAGHPLSVFGEAARRQREQAIATFAEALEPARLPATLHAAAARGLWLAHLGLILYFIHDGSERQARTLRLAERVADLFCVALRLAALPGASRLLRPALEALADAGLSAPTDATGQISR